MIVPTTCVQCNKGFDAAKHGVMYCSNACKTRTYRENRRRAFRAKAHALLQRQTEAVLSGDPARLEAVRREAEALFCSPR